jgi:hypothetical protein
LRPDPLLQAVNRSPLTFALDGRLTQTDVAVLQRHDGAPQSRLVRRQENERRAALAGLAEVSRAIQRTQAPVIRAVQRLGGRIISTSAIGNRITVTVSGAVLDRLAALPEVASIGPAPLQRPMGLDSETAAMGAPSFWSAGLAGSSPSANGGAGVNLAINQDKIQEDHPAFSGIDFERPQGVGVGTAAGTSNGASTYDHGTAVASFAISRGASQCPTCIAADANETGIAPALDHVLDNDVDDSPTAPAYDAGAWQLGFTETVWNNASQSYQTVPGAPYPAEITSDSHGSYTTADDSIEGQGLDNWVSSFGLTTTEPSGNDGQNGSGSGHITDTCLAYDVICVGGVDYHGTTDASDDTVAPWSSQGPTPAGRKKPDLVANGQPTGYARRDWWNGLWQSNTWGTSYASPQVAGGAALLYSAGVTDPMAIKAVLIDSARLGRAPGCSPSPCAMGTQTGWQPGWGFGELDLTDAYAQRTNFAEGAVSGGSARFYRADVQQAGDRATLVWNRRAVGCLDPGCSSTTYTLTNLDLKQLAPDCTVEASSASAIDNVEQVRATPTSAGQQVLYDVKANSSVDGLPAEPFSLASTRQLTPLVSPAPSVTLTPSAAQLEPGQDVTITAAVANPSPDLTADQASVTLNLPAGVELVSGGGTQQLGSLSRQSQAGDQGTASWVVRAVQNGTYSLVATTSAEHCGEHFTDEGATAIVVTTPQPPGGSGEGVEPPGGANPTPISPPASGGGLASPRLRVRESWGPKGLRVYGTLARGTSGHVTVVYSAKTAGRRRRTVRGVVHRSRFVVLLRVRRRGRSSVTVEYPGDRTHTPQVVRLVLH